MPYPNEHACRLRDPGEFQSDSFRRMTRTHDEKEYSIIMGRLKGQSTMTEQTYRYAKDKWSESEAQTHCKNHKGHFEAAENQQQMAVFMHGELLSQESHDAILQTLDRWIPDAQGYYFNKASFEQTVQKWVGIPLVFANEHPDMKLFATNQEEALKRINGRIVGNLPKAWIETVGHPRLMGQMDIDDVEALNLYNNGQLSHSTAFFCGHNENRELIGTVIPNHILLFKEDGATLPKDRGAFILNKEVYDMVEEGIENAGKVISAKNESRLKALLNELMSFFKSLTTAGTIPENDEEEKNEKGGKDTRGKNLEKEEMEKIEEVTAELEKKHKEEIEKVNAEHEAAVKGLNEKIAAFEQKEAEAEKELREKQWAMLKSKIPPGLTHKEEDEKTLREDWEKDPHTFAVKMTEFTQKAATTEEGDEFEKQADEYEKTNTEFEARLGKVS